jgi:Winged helix-turn helix
VVAVLSMSKQEFSRLEVLLRVQSGRLRVSDACVLIGLQRRQVFRLLRGLKQDGAASLLSKRRGRPSNHRLPTEVRTLALSIVRERYCDFGPSLAAEKLAEHHGCSVSRETLRGWMIAEGLWRDRRQRLPSPHQPRRRRDCLGELVQIDGSEHAWFEDRGPPCTLLAFVDDATSRLLQLRFVASESAFDYFRTTRAYLEEHGKPVAFYSDKHGIFRVNRKDATGGDGVTQFGRALLALNIDIICANSPQAKGRIERAFGTLQDRMVKSLPSRRRGSCGWRGYHRLLRQTHGCPGSSPPTTRALAVTRPMLRICIGRWHKPMTWMRSWPGGRSARSRAT